jgi:hypothetical protein
MMIGRGCAALLLILLRLADGHAAGLSDRDDGALANDLQALSKSWVQDAVGVANDILWRPQYTRIQ